MIFFFTPELLWFKTQCSFIVTFYRDGVRDMFFLIAVIHIIIVEVGWWVFICTGVFGFSIWSEEGMWPVPCLSASLGINKHFENDIIVSVSGIVTNISIM